MSHQANIFNKRGSEQIKLHNPAVKSFAWSLKPVFYLISAISGLKLDLSTTNNSSRINIRTISALGFLLLLSNALVNGCQATYNLLHATENLLKDLSNPRRTATLTVDVQCRLQMAQGASYYYRNLLLILGVPLIFSANLVLTGKWKRLWSNLQTIQEELRLGEEFYTKCRKRSYLGLVLFHLLLAPIFYDYASRWNRDVWYWHQISRSETLYNVAYALHNWSRGIELAIQIVFFVLVMTAALLFEELGKRLPNSSKTSIKLDRWKRHYHLVCCFLEAMNSTFGLILLIQIGYITMEMTTDCYQFMWAFKKREFDSDDGFWVFVINYIHVLARLLIVTISSWHMQNQEYGLNGAIFNLPSHDNPQQQLEMNTVLLHLSSFPISISAADVMKIDLMFALKVVSAALNYGSILYQDRLTVEIRVAEMVDTYYEFIVSDDWMAYF